MTSLDKEQILANAVPFEYRCGVYILICRGEIVYVGQSRNVFHRIGLHGANEEKVFDSYSIIECEPQDLNDLEAELIVRFAPMYNVTLPLNNSWITLSHLRNSSPLKLPTIRRSIKNRCIKDTNGYYRIADVAHILRGEV